LLRNSDFQLDPLFDGGFRSGAFTGETAMLETIAILLIILWLLGLVSSYTLGGFIHVLLVIAVVIIILRVIQGRSPV
jgi:predicted ferric reductase